MTSIDDYPVDIAARMMLSKMAAGNGGALTVEQAQWVYDRIEMVEQLEDTLERLIPLPEPGYLGAFRVGKYSAGDLPDQEDPGSHAVPGCECGDWEDGVWDPRCAELYEWRLAILHDEGGHGESFVRWLTEYEERQVAKWEVQP
jgi:hypothetical protein